MLLFFLFVLDTHDSIVSLFFFILSLQRLGDLLTVKHLKVLEYNT